MLWPMQYMSEGVNLISKNSKWKINWLSNKGSNAKETKRNAQKEVLAETKE